MAGKLLGPNFIARLLRVLPWAETQMGRDAIPQPTKPQILFKAPEVSIPFRAVEDIPAYGVITPAGCSYIGGAWEQNIEGDESSWYIRAVSATTYGDGGNYMPFIGRLAYINGADAVAAGSTGVCYSASEIPRWALINPESFTTSTTLPLDEWNCGPVPGSFELHAGLPGFIAIGPESKFLPPSPDPELSLALVVRDPHGVGWAKAIAGWEDNAYPSEPIVRANPCSASGNAAAAVLRIYDGVDSEPEITIQIALPRNGTGRDPNIKSGNYLAYRMSYITRTYFDTYGGYQFLAAGDYLDDKIGTVKMWAGTVANIPQGWRVYSAISAGDFIRHHATTAGGTGTFGTTGTNYAYRNLIVIERFE